MTENEYINMENLTTLRNVRSILVGLIADNVVTDEELDELRRVNGNLLRRYTDKIDSEEIIIQDEEE